MAWPLVRSENIETFILLPNLIWNGIFPQNVFAAEAAAAGQPVRADDNAESLKIRLMAYYKQTSPLIGYYYAKGDLSPINGLGEIDVVAKAISKILDA